MQNAIGKLTLVLATVAVGVVLSGDSCPAVEPSVLGTGPAAEYLPRDIEESPTGFPGFYMERRPHWYFNVEGVALKRDAYNELSFAHLVERVWTERFDNADPPVSLGFLDSTDTRTPALGTNNLLFDFAGGGRATVGRTFGDWYSVEASYMAINSWDELGAAGDATDFVLTVNPATGDPLTWNTGSLFSPFSNFGDPVPIDAYDFNTQVAIRYQSSLQDIEWILRRAFPMPAEGLQASVLVGGRFTTIEETFSYHSESTVPAAGTTVDVTTSTDNSMLGVQIGAMFEFQVEPTWWVDAEIKGVMYSNVADQATSFRYNQPAGAVPDVTIANDYAANDTVSSFGLDLRLMFTTRITNCLFCRVGYQAFWIDGVALASENMPRSSVALESGPVLLGNSPGRVVYHGPSLGVMGEW